PRRCATGNPTGTAAAYGSSASRRAQCARRASPRAAAWVGYVASVMELPTPAAGSAARKGRSSSDLAPPLVAAVTQHSHRDADDAVGDPVRRLREPRAVRPILRRDRV